MYRRKWEVFSQFPAAFFCAFTYLSNISAGSFQIQHKKQLHDAEVNHCLSFEQVSDELIAQYNIPNGNFDTITGCKYSIPSFLDIGKLYSIMIEDCARPGEEAAELIRIFSSFISDEISNFKTGLYYETPSYLECSYREGRLLD